MDSPAKVRAREALEAVARFVEENPGVHIATPRDPAVLRKYGLTQDEYTELHLTQRGLCAICGGRQRREFAIDHCHTTGKVRGLLCGKCNTALGQFGDDPETLRKAIAYLEKSRA